MQQINELSEWFNYVDNKNISFVIGIKQQITKYNLFKCKFLKVSEALIIQNL